MIIAIDGPSGAGKGTVARAVAARLGYRHVDTGAMYRAVGWLALKTGVALDDEAALAALATGAAMLLEGGEVVIDGHDVTREIRSADIDRAASAVARLPRVRTALVERQRAFAQESPAGLVMEGRDIGTVVFPDAQLKIYLDASPEERARRRATDPAHADSQVRPFTDVASALAARDRLDKTRTASPLTIAPDAVVIDTTSVAVDEVVSRVVRIAEERLGRRTA